MQRRFNFGHRIRRLTNIRPKPTDVVLEEMRNNLDHSSYFHLHTISMVKPKNAFTKLSRFFDFRSIISLATVCHA